MTWKEIATLILRVLLPLTFLGFCLWAFTKNDYAQAVFWFLLMKESKEGLFEWLEMKSAECKTQAEQEGQ